MLSAPSPTLAREPATVNFAACSAHLGRPEEEVAIAHKGIREAAQQRVGLHCLTIPTVPGAHRRHSRPSAPMVAARHRSAGRPPSTPTPAAALAAALCACLVSTATASHSAPPTTTHATIDPDASHFGSWILPPDDTPDAMPAFRFTGGPPNDPASGAVAPTEPTIAHQVGNDRVVGAVLTNGEVSLRQDEGGAKLLNAYSAPQRQFRGGYGFLASADGAVLASTRVDTVDSLRSGAFNLTFGAGYVRKTVHGGGFSVDHVVLAPFGDDPALLSGVTITALRDSPAPVDLLWADQWAGLTHSLTLTAARADPQYTAAHNYSLQSMPTGGNAAIALVDHAWFNGTSTTGGFGCRRGYGTRASSSVAAINSTDDQAPCRTFLAALNAAALAGANANASVSVTTAGRALFPGSGGTPTDPDIAHAFDGDLGTTDASGLMAMRRRVRVGSSAGSSVTLVSVYGYEPEGFSMEALVDKYSATSFGEWMATTAASWSAEGTRLTVSGDDAAWVQRETAWHSYMLRAGVTFDSFYNERIINQHGHYLYLDGIQGAARDPVSHALGLVFGGPADRDIVKSVLRYTLKERLRFGSHAAPGAIPWGRAGFGADGSAAFFPSDLPLYVLFTLTQYVLGTRDTRFLAEDVSFNGLPSQTVGDAMWGHYRHLVNVTGVGSHGLLRILYSDHNDGIYGSAMAGQPQANVDYVKAHGESVMNAATAAYVLNQYAQVLALTGDVQREAEVLAFRQTQQHAVEATWTGPVTMAGFGTVPGWYKRLYRGNESLGWFGTAQDQLMWTETNAWALLGLVPEQSTASANRTAQIVETVDVLARTRSPIGAINAGPAQMRDGGTGYGGVWFCGNVALVAGFGRNGLVAHGYDEWRKNSLANHASVYPSVWLGVWSGPDVYNSVESTTPTSPPGSTRCKYGVPGGTTQCEELALPNLNMWSHSAPLQGVAALFGIEFTAAGVIVRPCVRASAACSSVDAPFVEAWNQHVGATFEFASPLLGLARTGSGPCDLSGWYAPVTSGQYSVTVELPRGDAQQCGHAVVGGVSVPVQRVGPALGAVAFNGTVAAPQQLAWSLSL